MIHHISAEHLTVDRVREILENNIKIDLSEDAKKRIVRCREYLDNKMETQKEPIYGITTGFGSLCNISIDKDQLSQLQKNLVMSHACGTGERVPAEIVKLMLLLKIQSLSYGIRACSSKPYSVWSIFQQRRAAGRVPAGIAGRFGRPGSAGQHVSAAAGPRRSGV